MNGFRRIKIAILSLLLPAMILLAGNAVFNWHVHKQADGALIVHSHPYHKSGSSEGAANHHHSSHECFSIHQLTSFLFVLGVVFFLSLYIGKTIKLIKKYKCIEKRNVLDALLPNRAPPVLL